MRNINKDKKQAFFSILAGIFLGVLSFLGVLYELFETSTGFSVSPFYLSGVLLSSMLVYTSYKWMVVIKNNEDNEEEYNAIIGKQKSPSLLILLWIMVDIFSILFTVIIITIILYHIIILHRYENIFVSCAFLLIFFLLLLGSAIALVKQLKAYNE